MNSFVQKFWLIFEPVLSALVVENLDNYISDYLPPYLDSIRPEVRPATNLSLEHGATICSEYLVGKDADRRGLDAD